MLGPLPKIGRRHFLASAAVGTIGALLPLSGARAAAPSPGSGAETLIWEQPQLLTEDLRETFRSVR